MLNVCVSDKEILKEQSHPAVSNVTSADVSLDTVLCTATSLVDVTNSI